MSYDLAAQFDNHVKDNTKSKGIETFGYLLAEKSSKGFSIRTVYLPEQSATDNMCEPTATGDILFNQYLVQHPDLSTIGWIHTHPDQTNFMSSMDLHTHYPFHLSSKLAVSVVVSGIL